ncbi:MAG: hypothetical protein AAF198_13250 [Pseudomonadota bacterium]
MKRAILAALLSFTGLSAPANTIIATEIEALTAEGVGLVTPAQIGLPVTLFTNSTAEDLARAFPGYVADAPPAVTDLIRFISKGRFAGAITDLSPSPYLLARLDHLERVGAVDANEALLRQVGTNSPELFQRWLRSSIWLGLEVEPCEVISKVPSPKPLKTIIFCTALNGDPNRAIAMTEAAFALGRLEEREANLILYFFDPEIFEDLQQFPAQPDDTAIDFLMRFDLGLDLPKPSNSQGPQVKTLNGFSPWRDRVFAAEALAKTGLLRGDQLIQVYREGEAPASGQPWDRIEAVLALLESDKIDVETLSAVFKQFSSVGLSASFSEAIGTRINADLAQTKIGRCVLTLSAKENAPGILLLDQEPPSPLRFVLRDSNVPAVLPNGRDLLESLSHLSSPEPNLRQIAKDLGVLRATGISDWADLIAMQIYAQEEWCPT